MRMGEIEIQDYARQLLDAHGEMAVVEAAQKARVSRRTIRWKRLKLGEVSKRP
jgi:hypothetical protein